MQRLVGVVSIVGKPRMAPRRVRHPGAGCPARFLDPLGARWLPGRRRGIQPGAWAAHLLHEQLDGRLTERVEEPLDGDACRTPPPRRGRDRPVRAGIGPAPALPRGAPSTLWTVVWRRGLGRHESDSRIEDRLDDSVSAAGPMRGHGRPDRPSSDPEVARDLRF